MDLIILMPTIAASSVVFFILLKIYLKLREYFPVTVECWFCCKKAKVPFAEANSWDCLNCTQYNGFLENGDYNRLIPSHFDEKLNAPRFVSNTCEPSKYMRSSPTLCANCNCNQQMKIAQLAMFSPFNPKNFDCEVERYSQQLEKIYGLCASCDATVAEVLKKQKKLYGIKSSGLEKHKPALTVQPALFTKRPFLFTHYVTILLGSGLFYCSTKSMMRIAAFNRFINPFYNAMDVLPNHDILKENLQITWLLIANNWIRFYDTIPSNVLDVVNVLTNPLDNRIIDAFIMLYTLELLRIRNTTSLLNVGTWIILFSLKMSSTAPEYLISIMQALVAVVFLYISLGSLKMERNMRLKMKLRKGKLKKKQFSQKKIESTSRKAQSSPTDTSHEMPSIRNEDKMKCDQPKPNSLASVDSTMTHSYVRPKDVTKAKSVFDFGLSHLTLGPRGRSSTKNHLTAEPQPYCGRLHDQIWSRSSILSPSRLNADAVDAPFGSSSPPQTRSSNSSSGLGSICSNRQDSIYSERIHDKLTVSNLLANQRYPSPPSPQRNYCDLFPPPSSPEFAYPTLSHYHFTAAQLQRSYPFSSSTPQSTFFLNNANSSPTNSLIPFPPFAYQPHFPTHFQTTYTPNDKSENYNNKYSVFHNVVFPVSVFVLIVCNVALLGLVYYKELSVKNSRV